MIKIVHITSSLKRGGAEEVLCSLIEQLDTNIFESHLFYFHAGPHIQRLQDKDVHLYHIHGMVFMHDPWFWYRLFRTLIHIQPDCIHALLWSAHIAGRLAGKILCIPVITAYHNQTTLLSGIRALLDKHSVAHSTKMVAVSPTVARSLYTSYPWIRTKDLAIIPNGIDPSQLSQIATQQHVARAALSLAHDARIVGTVARFHPIKKLPLLLYAYKKLMYQHPNLYLLLVGQGPQENSLRQLSHALEFSHRMILITGQPAFGYYHLFDCFVLPSEQEGMSMALLEALYYQCPCIVAHAHDTHDVITHHENGLIVPPNDIDALAQAIHYMLDQKETAQDFTKQARNTVISSFSTSCMVHQYQQIFMSTTQTILLMHVLLF